MDTRKDVIGVVPVGEIPEFILKVITAHITGYLQLPAEILPPLSRPEDAFIASRQQYDAGRILKAYETKSIANHKKVIAVMDVDLAVPIFTFVFGEASQNGRYALVSLFRLARNQDGTAAPNEHFLLRTAKIALHELGHLFNVFHCDNPECLMHFSGDLEDLDNTPLKFCDFCALEFKNSFSA